MENEIDALGESLQMTTKEFFAPNVHMHLVPYAVTCLPDLSGMLERRTPCNNACKSSVAMTTLLTRCTNAGSRGWDASLKDVLVDGNGCTKILFQLMASVCTGMHPALHPTNRPCWEDRMLMYRVMCTMDCKSLLSRSGAAMKEMVRLYVAVMMSNMPATREAMLAASHPAGHLNVSPFQLPPVALVAAMTKIMRAAVCVCVLQRPTEMFTTSFANQIVTSVSRENKSRKVVRKKKRNTPIVLVYTSSWLGRSKPLCIRSKKLVDESTSVFSDTFKSEFVPMWQYQSTRGHRLSRLEVSQHEELHAKNPALRLCKQLPDAQSLEVQRIALTNKQFAITTLERAAFLLGIDIVTESDSGTKTYDILNATAEEAAKLLTMARVSAGAEKLLAYNLGSKTRHMHVEAVCRRLLQPRRTEESDEEALIRLPKTATHLMLCVECQRVANACQNGSGKKSFTFNEIGAISLCLNFF
jgi:hypothetical protein